MSSVIGDILAHESQLMQLALSKYEIALFEAYATELKKWNSKVNLTAITKDKEIAVKHFLDSLSLASFIQESDSLLDIGSGAGLPVIPLKIVRPETKMVSVDAVAKKIHFQRHIIRILNLQRIEAMHARIEDLHKTHPKSFSVITSRAFTSLDKFVTLAAPLLSDDGLLIAMKGDHVDDEIALSDEVLGVGGFVIESVHHYKLPYDMGKRVLTLLKRHKAL